MEEKVIEVLKEYKGYTVTDCKFDVNGTRIDNVYYDEGGVHFYAGALTDKYFEEVFPDNEVKNEIYEYILEEA